MKKKYFDLGKFTKNIYKRNVLLLIAVSSTVVLSTGCESIRNKLIVSDTKKDQILDSKTSENQNTKDVKAEESNISEVTPTVEENSSEESINLFSELSKYQFVFSSGAGAWQTILNIYEDGTFIGHYSDYNMGDTGEDHPNGINYLSTFEGKFTTPKRINDYTYSMSIESMKLEKEVGSEEIIEGIKMIYSEPYGLNDAKEIYIYTTQAPLEELPEGYKNWIHFLDLSDKKEEHLPFYGLYNVETESGFSSYLKDEVVGENTDSDITAEVAAIEKQYEEMNDKLKNENLTQSEMNFLAKEIYELWDDEINKVWGYLKDTLDKDTMDNLTSQQREWIAKKESEIKKAGSEYEGGSMRPMVEYLKGAELTRDRVYELIELLK